METEVLLSDYSKVVCPVVELSEEEMVQLADELDRMQESYHDGRGISHIKSIIVYLRRKQYDLAFNVYRIEGDKTGMYPEIKEFLAGRMGCRQHGVKNCPGWLCSS